MGATIARSRHILASTETKVPSRRGDLARAALYWVSGYQVPILWRRIDDQGLGISTDDGKCPTSHLSTFLDFPEARGLCPACIVRFRNCCRCSAAFAVRNRRLNLSISAF